VNGGTCAGKALATISLALLCCLAAAGTSLPGGQKRKNEEPKSQVQPLPPQPPMALKADAGTLDFHLSPLLKAGGLAAQIRQSLNDLIRDTRGETIVKLRAFVAGAGDARRVQAEVVTLFTERRLPLPVLSVVQVGALGQEAAKVVIEAVVSTRRQTNPNGLAFFAGQGGNSFGQALGNLQKSVKDAGVAPDAVLVATCFTARLEDLNASHNQARAAFPHANVNLVQALRDPASEAAACEGIAQLAKAPETPLLLLESGRAALVAPRPLVFTGLQLSFGSYLDDAHEAFVRLERAATALDPVQAPVHVNVFSLDPAGGSALRKTTAVPPSTFTVQTVEGLPSIDATAGIEAILAPGVDKPTLHP
jgi:enamine deaminase RidA (YjgF/YER057c/UK114 family)